VLRAASIPALIQSAPGSAWPRGRRLLIDPVAKTILNIGNQDAAKKNISNYAEATEVLNPQTKTFSDYLAQDACRGQGHLRAAEAS